MGRAESGYGEEHRTRGENKGGSGIKRKLTVHSDPNHSWLEVPLSDLTTLGVADEISSRLYRYETSAYLEDDVDAYVYLRAARQAGWSITTEDGYVDRDSFVRNLPAYNS